MASVEPLRLAFPVRQAQAPETPGASCVDRCGDRVQDLGMTTRRTIKVHIPITVEIDVEDWQGEYGGDTVRAIRDDVKVYVHDLVNQHMGESGLAVLRRPWREYAR